MRILMLGIAALLIAPVAMAAHYGGITLSPRMDTLVLHTAHGDVFAPRTDKDQEGFAQPHIAPDGSMVGWLELVPLQGNDGPIPGALVIFRDGKVLRRFRCGDLATAAWAFADGGKAIVCVQSTLHFQSYFVYELRRISDGRLLDKFGCGRSLVGTAYRNKHFGPWVNDRKVPAWVWPVAMDCPVR